MCVHTLGCNIKWIFLLWIMIQNILNSGSNQIWKRHVHPNVHHSTVYNSQDMEAT